MTKADSPEMDAAQEKLAEGLEAITAAAKAEVEPRDGSVTLSAYEVEKIREAWCALGSFDWLLKKPPQQMGIDDYSALSNAVLALQTEALKPLGFCD